MAKFYKNVKHRTSIFPASYSLEWKSWRGDNVICSGFKTEKFTLLVTLISINELSYLSTKS